MKKTLSIFILAVMFIVTLTSCTSIDTYRKNLGADYDIDIYSDDKIEEFANSYDIDHEDYDIKEIIRAEKDSNGYYAYVIKCGSKKLAKELEEELEEVVDLMRDYFYVELDVVTDGKFVLVGNKDVIEDALK